jgi:uncharacterized protein YrrD
MLRSIKQLHRKTLGTPDGDIGHVTDFYFNDQQWVVRYVIADTGSWLPGRLVLISPHAFGEFHEDSGRLLVNLTRQQIEDSPPIALHKPVSRQYEEEYHRYYGWPSYWVGGGKWGVGAFPSSLPMRVQEASFGNNLQDEDNPHLRSTQALSGYHIQTREGTIGQLADFMMDDQSWSICHLVVETGHWFSRKEIVISPQDIESISCEESKLFVNVTKEAIREVPEALG